MTHEFKAFADARTQTPVLRSCGPGTAEKRNMEVEFSAADCTDNVAGHFFVRRRHDAGPLMPTG